MNKYIRPLWILYLLLIYLPLGIPATVLCAVTTVAGCRFGDDHFWGYYPGRIWSRFLCMLTFSKVTIEGLENLEPGKSYVFAANHASPYDIFLIYGNIDRPFKWMMKEELRRMPVIGWACEGAGFIFVQRGAGKKTYQSIIEAKKKLCNGMSLVIFPEGTRSIDGEVAKFKRGGFEIAKSLELPIAPVSLSGTFQVMPKNAAYPVPHHMTIRFHKPVEDSIPEDHNELIQYMENIRKTIREGKI